MKTYPFTRLRIYFGFIGPLVYSTLPYLILFLTQRKITLNERQRRAASGHNRTLKLRQQGHRGRAGVKETSTWADENHMNAGEQ